MKIQELKTIKVTDDIHQRLVKRGKWGQPMTKIIEDLLNDAEGKTKK